jgi:hypothetical protein
MRDALPLLLLYSEYPPARKHRASRTLANHLNVLPQRTNFPWMNNVNPARAASLFHD